MDESKHETGSFQVVSEISAERVASLLCCGFEGGVGYWCRIFGYRKPRKVVAHISPDDGEVFPHIDYPLCAGGAVLCYETEVDGHDDEFFLKSENREKLLVLDRAAIERGLRLMPTASPRQWGRFLSQDDDADTGDVFIQLCLLGEVRYG
jgi:hypothetical protein